MDLVDVYVEGLNEPIGCTSRHPFWSVTRGDWVAACALQTGELLLDNAGKHVQVVSVNLRDDCVAVYNLEVDGPHVYRVSQFGLLVHNASWGNNASAAHQGVLISGRINKAGETLDDLFEYANPKLASKQGLDFTEEGHHFWPKWLGGPVDGPLLNTRQGIHRGPGVGMHQRMNDSLASSGLVPANMINNSTWVVDNISSSSIKRFLYGFYKTNFPNLPGVVKRLNDAAKKVSF